MNKRQKKKQYTRKNKELLKFFRKRGVTPKKIAKVAAIMVNKLVEQAVTK